MKSFSLHHNPDYYVLFLAFFHNYLIFWLTFTKAVTHLIEHLNFICLNIQGYQTHTIFLKHTYSMSNNCVFQLLLSSATTQKMLQKVPSAGLQMVLQTRATDQQMEDIQMLVSHRNELIKYHEIQQRKHKKICTWDGIISCQQYRLGHWTQQKAEEPPEGYCRQKLTTSQQSSLQPKATLCCTRKTTASG